MSKTYKIGFKALLFIYSSLMCSSFLLGTDQVFDTVVYEEKLCTLTDCPLDDYWLENGPRPKFQDKVSSNWRGYVATWQLENRKLSLNKIDGFVDGKRIDLTKFFETPAPIHASWYTGTLQVVEGNVDTGSYGDNVTRVTIVNIEDGMVIRSKSFENSKLLRRGRVGMTLDITEAGTFQIKKIETDGPIDRSKAISVGDEVLGIRSEDWGEKLFAGGTLTKATGFIRGLDETLVELLIKPRGTDTVKSVPIIRTW